MKIRRILAIWTAKLISTVCKLSGRQGVTLAGKVALKIDPTILEGLAAQVREKIFVVCGTNGKTTTNNLLCAAIEAEGKKLVCNRTGSNMLQGVVAAFVLAAKNNGKLDADFACLEVDEASTLHIFPHLKPDYMVLTNLFRDQLDRYGEIDITMDMLDRAMKVAPEMTVVVNGDDPLSAYLAMSSGNSYLTFGISEQAGGGKKTYEETDSKGKTLKTTDEDSERKKENCQDDQLISYRNISGKNQENVIFQKVEKEQKSHEVRDGSFCKKCGARLNYDFYHYGQIGMYHCSVCDFKRPEVDFEACKIDMSQGLAFDVRRRPKMQEGFDGDGIEKTRKCSSELDNLCQEQEYRTMESTESSSEHISVDYRGFYNVYNILAAYSVLKAAGVNTSHFVQALQEFRPQNGRMEAFTIDGCRVILNLAKNPAGFNQNIEAVMEDKSEKDIIIAINDNAADGTDVSWLWDVDFDQMKDSGIQSITTCGIRYLDMQLRLKYVDIDAKAVADIKSAIEAKVAEGSKNLYVLVNYTALFSTRKILVELQKG